MKKTISMLAMLLAVMMVVTSCGGGSAPAAPAAPAAPGAPAAPAAPTKTHINLTLNQAIESLDPWNGSTLIGQQLFYQIYDTIMFLNDSNEYEPRIAESVEVSEDGLSYTFKIKEGIKAHNGKPVTAEDVAYSFEYAFGKPEYSKSTFNNLSTFAGCEVVDDLTVVVKSSEPCGDFLSYLATRGYILEKDEMEAAIKAEKFGIEWVPAGTGPYMISSYAPDAEVKLEAFKDYYRGEARMKTATYQILGDNNTIVVGFEAGDIDFITVPTASWANISTNSNYNSYLAPTAHSSFFEVNIHNNDALSNKLVRQALSYAIDRESMVIAAYDGIADPGYSLANYKTVFGGFSPEELTAAGINAYEYNPEKAKALLAEAGYPNGVDVGTILTINSSYWEKMSTIFQANLEAIGVTCKIELADSAACRARRKALDYNLATTGSNITPDAGYYYSYLRYVDPADYGKATELCCDNKELEEAFLTAKGETNPEKRKAAFLEWNRITQDGMYIIPTFYKSTPYAYQKDLVCDQINNNFYHIYEFHWAA